MGIVNSDQQRVTVSGIFAHVALLNWVNKLHSALFCLHNLHTEVVENCQQM